MIYKMFLCTLNTSISLSYENAVKQLKSVGIVAVGDLIKTPTGYSPLLLTKNTNLEVSSEKLIRTSDSLKYYFENVDLSYAIWWLSQVTDLDMKEIYEHLYTGSGAAVQARSEGYFFADSCLDHISGRWIINEPLIRDGYTGSSTWCLMIPFDITVNELVFVIKKYFGSICGVLINEDRKPSVYFFKSNHCHNNEYDYRHCISHIIDEKAIQGYYASRTYGEERQRLTKNLAELVDPSYVPRSYEDLGNQIKLYATSIAEISMYKSDEPYPLENRKSDNTMAFITEPFGSVQYFLNIPLDVQIMACAKVAEISVDEMVSRLRACTDPEIKF